VSRKQRRRLIVAITLAGLVATVWSMRARVLARNEQDFQHRYGG
jgi:hypothetical protein